MSNVSEKAESAKKIQAGYRTNAICPDCKKVLATGIDADAPFFCYKCQRKVYGVEIRGLGYSDTLDITFPMLPQKYQLIAGQVKKDIIYKLPANHTLMPAGVRYDAARKEMVLSFDLILADAATISNIVHFVEHLAEKAA